MSLQPSGCKQRRFESQVTAEKAVAKGAEGVPAECWRGGHWHLRHPAEHLGFSDEVKLLTRIRAGNGSVRKALCEACGIWLGSRAGQVQHIIGRGMGGCTDAVINSLANAALLCGTPFEGCHGLATAFDEEMGARGFWLKRGTDPRLASMMLAGESGTDLQVWRAEDGIGDTGHGYLFARPELVAA